MKRIVQINSAINCGSTGKIAEQIGKLAMKQGWECFVAHSHRYSRDTELTDISTSRNIDEKIHYLATLLTDRHGTFSRTSTKQLVKKLEEIKPDLVHLHNIHGHYVNYPILFDYLKRTGVPVVWTLHDCWSFTGHCVYFDAIGCEKWRSGCYQCPLKKGYPTSLFDGSKGNYERKKKVFDSLENLTLIPVSEWLSGLLGESYMSKYPRKVIHNGIDLSVFTSHEEIPESLRERQISPNVKIVLGVADGFDKRKGLYDFVELAKRLGPSYQIVLVGVTDGYEAPGIITLGRTKSQAELVAFYSIASVFVNPTYEDNFPTTNLEALACGSPVITYRTGGSPESIDEKTGEVIEKGDVAALANAIINVCSKGKSYYADACREKAVNNYDKDERFMDYIRLYESLLNKD